MSKTRGRRAREAERDRESSEELRRGGPDARRAAIRLGTRGGRSGGQRAHRIGGLARVVAARRKGGKSRSAAKIEAARENAKKARDARLAKKKALEQWEKTEPADYKPEQTEFHFG